MSIFLGNILEKLIEEIINRLPYKLKKEEYLIPYADSAIAAYLHRNANVNVEEYREQGIYIHAEVDKQVYNVCKRYMIGE